MEQETKIRFAKIRFAKIRGAKIRVAAPAGRKTCARDRRNSTLTGPTTVHRNRRGQSPTHIAGDRVAATERNLETASAQTQDLAAPNQDLGNGNQDAPSRDHGAEIETIAMRSIQQQTVTPPARPLKMIRRRVAGSGDDGVPASE